MAYQWRAGPDVLSSGEEPGTPSSTVFRRVFQGALAAGTAYAGYRAFGPALGAYGRATARRVAMQARAGTSQVLGSYRRGEYGRAATQAYNYITAPIQHTFGARGLDIVRDTTDTSRMLYGFPGIPPHVALTGWRHAAVAPGQGPIRNLLIGDVMNLPRNASIFDATPHRRESLGGSLRLIRAQMLRIQRLEASGRLPAGTLGHFTNVPVDRAVFRTRGGGIHDLRSLDPAHWGLNVWDRFALPKIDVTIPSFVPRFGGDKISLMGGGKPLSWLANLTLPVELLRKQPISRGVRILGPLGKEAPHLYSRSATGGQLRSLKLVRGEDRAVVNTTTPVPSPRAMRRRYPGEDLAFEVGPIEEQGVRLAAASSPIGKGVRIRKGYYHHDLPGWMQTQGIDEASKTARVLRFLDEDRWGIFGGIGPHLTSPQIFEEADPTGAVKKVARNKVGALEQMIRNIFNIANRADLPELGGGHAALGEANLQRFVSLKAQGNIAKTLGAGALGSTAQGVADYANYSLMRPLYLLEDQLGLGLRHGKHAGESLWRLGTRVVVPAYFLSQGLRYFDFKAGEALGISPSDFLFNSYASAQVLRAKALEKTGLQDTAQKSEDLFPGSVSSPLSAILRTVLGGAGGAVLAGGLRRRLLRRSSLFGHEIFAALMPLLGAGTGAFLAGSNPLTSSKSLQRQYSGEELVPVKRSRWWELGRDSYFGRDIMYYRPHWLAMRRNRTWEKSVYGSEADYWKHGNALSPLKYLDPYWLERRHQQERPYPESGTFFGDVPIVGPVLEATLGRLMKPVRRHPALNASMEQMGERWSGERNVPSDVGQRLGLPVISGPESEGVVSRYEPGQVAGKTFSHGKDWLGMQGFLWGTALEKATGDKTPFGSKRQLETSERMSSTERWFYGLELGGGFQTYPVPGSGFFATEFLRRFIPHRDRSIELVNPIPNNMPDWLPGPRSAFPGDQNFYLPGGFQTGDPYTKIPQGDVRLPGPGYESVRPLHSGIPGVYDPVDRLMILEDVAPYSESAKHYRTIVQAWSKAGVLDDSWKQQVLESSVRKERRAASKSFGVKNLYAAPGTIPLEATIEKVTSPTTFKTYEYPYTFRLAGFETSNKKLYVRELESANASTYSDAAERIKAARFDTKEKLKSMVGQTVQMQISSDQASRYVGGKVMALVPGISPPGALRSTDQEGLAAYTRGGAVTRGAANLYYGAASAEPIDPILGWLKNKLFPIRSSVEDYYKFQVLGNRFGMWETPYESYVKPWLRNIPGQVDYVPHNVQEQRETFRNFEALRYLKGTKMAQDARAAGEGALAEQFDKDLNRNYLGMNPRSPRQAALYMKQAVSPAERDYIEGFGNLRTTAERQRVLKLVPEESQYILSNLWQQDLPVGVKLENANLSNAARRFSPWDYPRESLNEFLATRDTPAQEWEGWDPRVAVDAAKIKWIENQGDNIHNHGLWESEQRKYGRQFPNLQPPVLTERPISAERVHNNLARLGLETIEERGGLLFDYAGQARLEVELRRQRRRSKGYDGQRKQFENSRVFFPEPA